jgi:hypothetical protein
MPIDNAHQHPSRYTDAELLAMLRTQRLEITQRLNVLNRAVQEQLSEITTLEAKLENIEANEIYLTVKPTMPSTFG